MRTRGEADDEEVIAAFVCIIEEQEPGAVDPCVRICEEACAICTPPVRCILDDF